MKLLIKYWKKIPERHYFPIFVFTSLFFVLNELIVLSLIFLYVVAEKKVRSLVSNVTKKHERILWIAAISFFLIMIDDYLLMAIIIGFVMWDARKKNLQKRQSNNLN